MRQQNKCGFINTMDLEEAPFKSKTPLLTLSYLLHTSMAFNLLQLYHLKMLKLKMTDWKRMLRKSLPIISLKRKKSIWLSKDVRRALFLAIANTREEIAWFTLKTSFTRFGNSSLHCKLKDL
jgi:hypothetical protein